MTRRGASGRAPSLSSSLKVKSGGADGAGSPVQLPHDGPLYHAIDRMRRLDRSAADDVAERRSNAGQDGGEVRAANFLWQLLQEAAKEEDGSGANNDHQDQQRRDDPTSKLFRRLLNASSLKEQLHALQVHRSTMLQQQPKEQQQQNQEHQGTPPAVAEAQAATNSRSHADDEASSSSGTESVQASHGINCYRILLEWSISNGTTLPLRRAVQSNLNDVILLAAEEDVQEGAADSIRTRVTRSVLSSMMGCCEVNGASPSCCWKDALSSFNHLISYTRVRDLIIHSDDMLGTAVDFLYRQSLALRLQCTNDEDSAAATPSTTDGGAVVSGASNNHQLLMDRCQKDSIERGIRIADLLKVLLASTRGGCGCTAVALEGLATFLFSLLKCEYVPSESLWSVTLAYCRVRLQQQQQTQGEGCGNEGPAVQRLLDEARGIRGSFALASTCLLQGIAAAVSETALLRPVTTAAEGGSNTKPQQQSALAHTLFDCFRFAVLESIDPDVRLAGLKGLRALTSRSNAILDAAGAVGLENDSTVPVVVAATLSEIANRTLPVTLQAWEFPPTRKIGNAIPALFTDLIGLLQKLDDCTDDKAAKCSGNSSSEPVTSQFDDLVLQILQQPLNCKGRYLALEVLLPLTGATKLLVRRSGEDANEVKQRQKSKEMLLCDLLSGIGDRGGHNTVAIADLWAKLLNQLLSEFFSGAGLPPGFAASTFSATGDASNRKRRKRQAKQPEAHDSEFNGDSGAPPFDLRSRRSIEQEHSAVVSRWLDVWVPSLAEALIEERAEQSRRKQVAAFCLPRIIACIGCNPASVRPFAAQAYERLLDEIRRRGEVDGSKNLDTDTAYPTQEAICDRVLWAYCTVAFYALKEGLLLDPSDETIMTQRMAACISKSLPHDRLKLALVHSSAFVRSAGFLAIEAVIAASHFGAKDPFDSLQDESKLWRYALPFTMKEGGNDYMTTILTCLISFLDKLSMRESALVTAKNLQFEDPPLPALYSFVVDFLLHDLVRKALYPGTVEHKEKFGLALLDYINALVAREFRRVAQCKIFPKNGPVFQRRRSKLEDETVSEIRKEVVSSDVVGSVFFLLHSIWDETRVSAFSLIQNMVCIAKFYSLPLPQEFSKDCLRRKLTTRATYLASSPRQREAGTSLSDVFGKVFLAFS